MKASLGNKKPLFHICLYLLLWSLWFALPILSANSSSPRCHLPVACVTEKCCSALLAGYLSYIIFFKKEENQTAEALRQCFLGFIKHWKTFCRTAPASFIHQGFYKRIHSKLANAKLPLKPTFLSSWDTIETNLYIQWQQNLYVPILAVFANHHDALNFRSILPPKEIKLMSF